MPRDSQNRWPLIAVATFLFLLLLPADSAPRDGIASARTSSGSATKALAQSSQHPIFARDIAPIIYQNCSTCHHSSEPGALCGTNAFPLLSYDDVKRQASAIVAVTRSRTMPPWLPEQGYGDFADSHRLTDAQIRLIADWFRDGAPAGPISAMPPAPHFSEGWQLGQPDLVLESSRSLSIPGSGPDVFWNFVFSPNLKTTRYVRAIEIRPGSDLSLVHHANLLLDPERSARHLEHAPGVGFPGMDLSLAGSPFYIPSHFLFWKPGGSPWVEPSGFAWRLDPGTDLVLNAHFMPIGTAETAKPSIGLYFTDQPPNRFPMLIELQNDEALDIPAGARDFVVSDSFRLPVDVDVLAVYPHAHYLGHILEGYATLPDGHRKWLIRIPDWDPKWQAVFHYREPVVLPAGTIISMRYHYDNSSANPRNPNSPPRRVQGGNQSTDEMAHLWFQFLPRGGASQRIVVQSALLQHRVDKYRNDFDSRLALGTLMLGRFNAAGAVPVLEQAVRIEPKQEEAHRFLGMALESVGRTPEAIDQFRAAIALKPGDAQARYNLARALVKAGKYDEARQNFLQVAAADPKNSQLRVDFGELLLRHGMAAAALDQFNAALVLDPSSKIALRDRDLARARLNSSAAP